jgi:predicted acyltransferase
VRDGLAAALWRILRRSIMLYLLGIFASGGLTNRWPDVAMGGVLQRIAACYFFAATFYCFFGRRPKAMVAIAGVLLVGYWAIVTLVFFPDLKLVGSTNPATISRAVTNRIHGVYEEGRNLTNYLDFRFLPGRKAQGYYINEGLLSTIPAIAICLFGTFAGRLLTDDRVKPGHKVGWLMLAGIAAIGIGLLWSLQFPLIKRIWTSSFCLVATGYASMMLGLFYLVVDVWKLRMWCQPFVWIGTNPITIYLMAPIIGFSKVAERLVGGDVKAFFDARVMPGFGGLVVALVGLGLAILLCGFLYRKKIFLRV